MHTDEIPLTKPSSSSSESPLRRQRRSRASSLQFFLPAAIQKTVPFLVLPVLTSVVSTDAYGQMIILTTVMLLGTTVFGLGLDTVIFYVAHRGSARNVAANLSALARLLLFAPILAGVVLAVTASTGLFSFLGVESLPLATTIVASAVYVTGSVFATSMYRLKRRLLLYAITIIGFSVVQQTTKLALIFTIDDPVLAWSLGDLAGALVVLVISLPTLISSIRSSATSPRRARRLLARGLPLVPSRLAQWILQMSDRALVVGILGASAGGIYGLAAQIGNLSGIFIIEVCRFMLPQLSKAGGEGPLTRRIHRTLPLQFVTSAMLAGCVAFAGPILLGLAFPKEYAAGATLIPALACAACIAGWFYSITDFIGVTLGKTKHLWLFTVAGSICGVGVNLALLPNFGTIAAALGSVAAYALMVALAAVSVRGHLKEFKATTRLTTSYCFAALVLMLASVPSSSTNNYWLASVGVTAVLVPGLLVLAVHHRSSTRN